MIKVWSYNCDIDEENLLIGKSGKILVRQAEINHPSMMNSFDKLNLSENNTISPFRQQVNIHTDKDFLQCLENLLVIVNESNDYGLRNVTFTINPMADGKIVKSYLIGGTSSKVYRMKLQELPVFEVEWAEEPFEFAITLDYEDIKALLSFINSLYNVSSIDIGGRKGNQESLFMIVHSVEIDNAVKAGSDNDDEDEDNHEGLTLFRIDGKAKLSPIMAMLSIDEEIEKSDVIYEAYISPSVKNTFKSDQTFVELSQNHGVMAVRSENTEKKMTSVMYTGCPLKAIKGELPDNGKPFAVVSSSDVIKVLEYKQPGKSSARVYEDYRFRVWFNMSDDGKLKSDFIQLNNTQLEVLIAQKMSFLDLPDETVFAMVKKGKVVEAKDEVEAMDAALTSAKIKKKDRLKMMTEMELLSEEELKVQKGVEEKELEAAPYKVEEDLEKEFRERTDSLQLSLNDIEEKVKELNTKLDSLEQSMKEIHALFLLRFAKEEKQDETENSESQGV